MSIIEIILDIVWIKSELRRNYYVSYGIYYSDCINQISFISTQTTFLSLLFQLLSITWKLNYFC